MKNQKYKKLKTAQAPLDSKRLTGQDIQDEIFRKMSVQKKLKLAFELFEFGKKLEHLRYQTYGNRRSFSKNS